MRETNARAVIDSPQEILVRFPYTVSLRLEGFPASKTCSHFGHCICVKSIHPNLSAGIENPHDGQNVRNTAANWQWWLRREVPSRSEYSRKSAQSKIRCTLERLRCPHQQRKACFSSAEGRTQCRTAPKPTCCLTLFCTSALLLHGGEVGP